MRKPSRHPLITLFLVFAFMAQATGLSGCADVEKAYKEATGQTVVDDSTVRAKLQTVNEMSDNAANQLIWMVEAANSAQAKGDAGDIKGMADVWINEVGPNAELLLSTIEQIEAAEQTIHEQTSAARTGSRPVSVEVAPAVSWAVYVIGAAALGYTFKQISDAMKEDRNKLESAAPGSAEEQAATKSIQERGAEAMKTLATTIVEFGVKTISTTAGAVWTIYDKGKKAVEKLRAIGGTKECSSELNQRRAGKMTNFSGSGCKIYVGEETSSGSSHTFENLPDGNWDMMTYASGLARTMYKGYATYGTDSSVDKTFITIDEATAKNIKDSDAGTYSGGGSSGGSEPSSGDFPIVYSGTGVYSITIDGKGTCSIAQNWTITLDASGGMSGLSIGNTWPSYDSSCNLKSCGSNTESQFGHSGSFSNGSFSLANAWQSGQLAGTYDSSSISGSGSAPDQYGAGCDGSAVTYEWSFTLSRSN